MQIYQNSQLTFKANPSVVIKDFRQLPQHLNVPSNHINDAKITLLKDEISRLQIEKEDLLGTIRSFGARYCSTESYYNKIASIDEAIQKLQSQIDIIK